MEKVLFVMSVGSLLGAIPCLSQCPSMDLTGDCFVDLDDFAVISDRWLKTQTELSPLIDQWLSGNRLSGDMVVIPAGTFQMGNSKDSSEGDPDEIPIHTVTVDSFAMDKFEITNGRYCAFLKSAYPSQLKVVNGVVYATSDADNSFPYCSTSSASSQYPNFGEYSQIAFSDDTFRVLAKKMRDMTNDPMLVVSWYGAVAYCNWRSQQEGKQPCYDPSTWECDFNNNGYRLPTEAEWEYAARGGLSGKRFPWGDTIKQTQANFYSSHLFSYDISPVKDQPHLLWSDGQYPFTSTVGFFDGSLKYKTQYNWPANETSYKTTNGANGYGLYDMAGNVWEWCNDWYGSYSSDSQTNPTGPATGSYRVFRGGSWSMSACACRVSWRSFYNHYLPSDRVGGGGFRIVLGLK